MDGGEGDVRIEGRAKGVDGLRTCILIRREEKVLGNRERFVNFEPGVCSKMTPFL